MWSNLAYGKYQRPIHNQMTGLTKITSRIDMSHERRQLCRKTVLCCSKLIDYRIGSLDPLGFVNPPWNILVDREIRIDYPRVSPGFAREGRNSHI
jgi:hypothetical protein